MALIGFVFTGLWGWGLRVNPFRARVYGFLKGVEIGFVLRNKGGEVVL